LLISCESSQENADNKKAELKTSINEKYLIGSWEDTSPVALHFTLSANGTAKSDNMSTLMYEKWYVKNDSLYLVAKSIGNKTSSIDTTAYEIEHLDVNRMKLKYKNKTLDYTKTQQKGNVLLNEADETMKNRKAKTLKGRLTLGHEANSFQPCESDQVFWVYDKTGKLKELYNELTADEKPYTPIYAEIEFIDKGKASEGFPAEYESVYEAVKIIRLTKISDSSCE